MRLELFGTGLGATERTQVFDRVGHRIEVAGDALVEELVTALGGGGRVHLLQADRTLLQRRWGGGW